MLKLFKHYKFIRGCSVNLFFRNMTEEQEKNSKEGMIAGLITAMCLLLINPQNILFFTYDIINEHFARGN